MIIYWSRTSTGGPISSWSNRSWVIGRSCGRGRRSSRQQYNSSKIQRYDVGWFSRSMLPCHCRLACRLACLLTCLSTCLRAFLHCCCLPFWLNAPDRVHLVARWLTMAQWLTMAHNESKQYLFDILVCSSMAQARFKRHPFFESEAMHVGTGGMRARLGPPNS